MLLVKPKVDANLENEVDLNVEVVKEFDVKKEENIPEIGCHASVDQHPLP